MESTDNLFKKLSFFPEPEFQEEILNNCKIVSFKKGDVIGKEGRNVKFLPIVIEGAKGFPPKRRQGDFIILCPRS